MADVVGQNQVELPGIERLATPEQLAGEVRAHELRAGSPGAVHDQHGVAHPPAGVLLRFPERPVVQAQLGEHLAGHEPEVSQNEVSFGQRRPFGLQHGRPEQYREQQLQHDSHAFLNAVMMPRIGGSRGGRGPWRTAPFTGT